MGIFGIISMIVVGFIVGVLARFLYPGAVSMGFWMTTLIGIGGSLVGGVIGSILFKSPDGRVHPAGWILSAAGNIAFSTGSARLDISGSSILDNLYDIVSRCPGRNRL